MCGSMVDMQSATAQIRRGNKRRRKRKKKPQDENIMSVSATQGGHKKYCAKTGSRTLATPGGGEKSDKFRVSDKVPEESILILGCAQFL